MSHLGRGWLARGLEDRPSPAADPRADAPLPAGAHTCLAPPTPAAAGAHLSAASGPAPGTLPGQRLSPAPAPKGVLVAPLGPLLHPHCGATGARHRLTQGHQGWQSS